MPKSNYGKQYDDLHRLIQIERGKASLHKCSDECGKDAYDWAHIHGTDEKDLYNYKPLCRSCHGYYDRSHLTKQDRLKICEYYGNFSQREIARMFLIDRNAVKRVWKNYGIM